jgi:arylsulfatase
MAEQPNVLLVTVDQWPGPLLGIDGQEDMDTPTLNQFARCGVRFGNAVSECPICIPARRSLMTGTSARVHGDRHFQPSLTRPETPLLADVFRDDGYQTGAVGKLHVYPPRDRMGFEDVQSLEEGRGQLGGPDDWEIWLADRGFAGQAYTHGMSNNDYQFCPWHLPEQCHPTVWATQQMCRMIQRRDPTRPAFWHLSHVAPHPPIVPPQSMLSHYAMRDVEPPFMGSWADDEDALPVALRHVREYWEALSPTRLQEMKRAFYAQCTYIDHQLRVVIGTLRESLLLDNTIILVTSDHGDMLGDHGLYAKRLMYRKSVNVPMILMGVKNEPRITPGNRDMRLAGMQDVMPTLLDLAGIPVPDSCTGLSLVGDEKHDTMYCEALENYCATRMITDGRWKLIWYPAGNHIQLFNIESDPNELTDLAADPASASTRDRLTTALVNELYGDDLNWIEGNKLIGFETEMGTSRNPFVHDRGLMGQRGLHSPEQPPDDPSKIVGAG